MTVKLDADGRLTVKASDNMEQYTLTKWLADWEAGKVTLIVELDEGNATKVKNCKKK